MYKIGIGIALAVLAAAPAAARVEFAAYEGPNAIQEGTGGTRIERDGVDFWTVGSPPRRYQVLGVLTDSRRNNIISGRAIGSAGLARRVRDLGGNGVIVLDQSQRDRGVVGTWTASPQGGSFVGGRSTSTTTTFVVVRYLD